MARFKFFSVSRKSLVLLMIALGSFYAGTSMAQTLSRKDADEIRVLAREKIKAFNDLLNAVSNDDLSNYERRYMMMNSYMPSNDQIFFNDGVVVEDDVDPKHTSSSPELDTPIEKYLSNFDLFYTKSDANTIEFSNIVVSDVKMNKYAFVKVFFSQQFKAKNSNDKTPYQSVSRVAELRADKVAGSWIVYLTGISFNSAANAIAAPATPVPSATYESAQKNGVQPMATASKPTDMKPTVAATPQEKKAAEKFSEQISKANQAQLDHTRKLATIKLGAGIAAFAFGAVTYAMLNKDFKDYKSKISNPEGLTSYAKPGIYISVGSAAAGLGVTVSSLLDFKKLKK
ncbi:hypothetical protein [Dyadobacter frigoris]|uniref:Uncharacterized protein n=2 Tax=Dyadobacter frigoris TaxID=2576211 RepID=A0A4U6CVW5_9BACT|nr:hypothetical protein [Dyadobacter frigoris]TKT88930.1 hypothetical protein FDK13_25200 [Dyadobacter frigoris]